MRIVYFLTLILIGCSIICSGAIARTGFSIEGGLLYDRPASGAHDRPYANMKSGIGFTINLGYDIWDRVGLELGAMHTAHEYELGIRAGGAIIEENADKTTFFLKARAIPFRYKKFETVIAAGAGFFDISGKRLRGGSEVDEDFSGPGFTGNLDFRYNVSEGLAISLYLGANFVNYKRYEIFGYKSNFEGGMPGGDSINWGLTIYHSIGMPQL
jgi:hypothetical protein